MFSRIKKQGNFTLSSGVKSSYNYDYSLASDTMNQAYCRMLLYKLENWQSKYGKLNVVVGIETEGIRIGYELSRRMTLPFIIMPKKRIDFAQLEYPAFPPSTHWLIVDDIATTGSSFLRAVDYLEIEEKPETITFASMIRRNPSNLDYSAVHGDPSKEQFQVRDERFDFIDKRLVSLYDEPE
ncbi:MAG: hypothetical protein VYC17_06925 [Nitrospinota bacterium]|nr:hypothetical protein [Nitrospinota bacterium]